MNSKERFLATIERKPTDRTPIDCWLYQKQFVEKLAAEYGPRERFLDEFNIDSINSGKLLFPLLDDTGDTRYRKALAVLRRQLQWQPRASNGVFWHKLKYPWQVWLDGLYMGAPFYAEYAKRFGATDDFDDVARQFRESYAKLRDARTGLLYHGWDESRVQPPRPQAKVFPRRDGAMYEEGWRGAIASNPEWITITSFNEWYEGTQIEPAASYGSRPASISHSTTPRL